jgi:hypothetical protein
MNSYNLTTHVIRIITIKSVTLVTIVFYLKLGQEFEYVKGVNKIKA